jgi:hypothetical protein
MHEAFGAVWDNGILGESSASHYDRFVRTILLSLVAITGCASMQRSTPDYTARYEVDADKMVPILINTTEAQHMRVAVIDKSEVNAASFVVVPTDAPDGTALVVHLSTVHDSSYFATCFGACRSSIAVTPIAHAATGAMLVGDAASDTAKARARQLLVALHENTNVSIP